MKKYILILIMLSVAFSSHGATDEEQLEELGYEASIKYFKIAVLKDDLQAIKIFINSGLVDEFREDDESEDPLGILIFDGSTEAFTIWLDYFKPKSPVAYERTMFMFIGFNKEEHALLLVDYIKEPNYVLDEMLPLLGFAAQRGMTELASQLIEAGANANKSDSFNNLPAKLAINNDHFNAFKAIIKSTDLESASDIEIRNLISSIIRSESYREEALTYLFENTNFPLTEENYDLINRLANSENVEELCDINDEGFSKVRDW